MGCTFVHMHTHALILILVFRPVTVITNCFVKIKLEIVAFSLVANHVYEAED